MSAAYNLRLAGSYLQRLDLGRSRDKAEFQVHGRSKRSPICELGVEFSYMNASVVAPDSKRIRHSDGDVRSGEVQGNSIVVHYQFAAANIEAANGQVEQTFQRILVDPGALSEWGLVGSAIGINAEMNDRAFHLYLPERYFPFKKRQDFEPDDYAVNVGIRNCPGSLQSVQGEISGLEAQVREVPLKAGELDTSASNVLNIRHHFVAD